MIRKYLIGYVPVQPSNSYNCARAGSEVLTRSRDSPIFSTTLLGVWVDNTNIVGSATGTLNKGNHRGQRMLDL